jgi:putative ABC transport system substrate-binding protein
MIDRRAFLGGAAASLGVLPAAFAQPQSMPVVGFLSALAAAPSAYLVAAFRKGLQNQGFIDGQNIRMELRWAENDYNRLEALATDLVQRRVNVIAATGGIPAAQAAQKATATIPIVFTIGDDPVFHKLVASLNNPGNNITGVYLQATTLDSKRLDYIKQLIPNAKRVAILLDPGNPQSTRQVPQAEADARAAGLDLLILRAVEDADFEAAFQTVAQQRVDALMVGASGVFTSRRAMIVGLAAKYAVPTIYQRREFVDAGGLISYGDDLPGGYTKAGEIAGQILKGAKPAVIPVDLLNRFELVINRKTADALGIKIPINLETLADDIVI